MRFKVTCKTCGGTGIYRHWTCKSGEAQECATCDGKGYVESEYFDSSDMKFFTSKVKVSDINTVVVDAFGCFNPGKERVPYEQWYNSK